jgi:hypothetical protein
LLAGLVLLGGCQREATTSTGVMVSMITDRPDEYYGKTVTVSGEIERVLGRNTFLLRGEERGDDLLVLGASPVAAAPGRTEEAPFVEEDIIQVTGLVQPFDASEAASTYGVTLDSSLVKQFEDGPVVVSAAGASVMSAVIVSARSLPGGASEDAVLDLSTVASAEGQEGLVGSLAIFRDVEVASVTGENRFWAADSTGRLFVVLVPEGAAAAPAAGGRLSLYGVLRELPDERVLRETWRLPDTTVQALQDHRAYLHAVHAMPAPRGR